MTPHVMHTGDHHYLYLRREAHSVAMSLTASRRNGHDLIVRALEHKLESILVRMDRDHEQAKAAIMDVVTSGAATS